MPATGYTPILLYGSAAGGSVPAASNLTNGTGGSEIAINITDGRLYYKDNNGVVQIIGAKLASTLAAALQYAPIGTGAVVLATAITAPAPNLLANGSAEFAGVDWSLPTQAGYTTGVNGEGTFFTIASAVNGTYTAVGADHAVAPGIPLALQAEVYAQGLTAGQLVVDLEFLDSTHTVIATQQAPLIVSADQGWTFMSNSATTPANTAYWHARFFMQNATLNSGAIRKIKVSGGTTPSPYSREADFPAIQANFATLAGLSTQVFNVATATTSTEATPLAQVQANFAAIGGSTLHEFSVANATLTQSAVPLIQILGGGDGVNYNNMSGSRSLNTAYTNTTGRVLVVCVQINALSPTHTDIAGAIQVGMSNASAINGAFASAAVTGNDFPPSGGNYSYSGSTMFIVPPNGMGMASFVPYLTDIVSSTYTWFEY